MTQVALDLISIGRSSVDLYAQQIGGRLEDAETFVKAVGGCPTNIAIGTARLGLKSAVITRVGDEHMGRFIREQLEREGVNVRGVHTDPRRLTSLVLLAVRDEKTFPLIFYRDNCADSALDESDIDEAFVASAGAIVVTGTHFSRPNSAAAQQKAIRVMRTNGGRVVFDVDYRPNLWGLAGHGAGEERYIHSDAVTEHLAPILPLCDLIVGTEEELNIAGGSEDVLTSIRAIRAKSAATIVCKRGPMGCVVFPADIPASIDDGIRGPGFPVEVYNVLGAGDAFMSGFLRGGSRYHALRKDAELNHIHWATTRRPQPDEVMALAIDHRAQLEAIVDAVGAPRERLEPFKVLAVKAAAQVARGRPGFGMLLDGTYGRQALFLASHYDFWLARPVEKLGSRPLTFDG